MYVVITYINPTFFRRMLYRLQASELTNDFKEKP